jgi:hypothetical protein
MGQSPPHPPPKKILTLVMSASATESHQVRWDLRASTTAQQGPPSPCEEQQGWILRNIASPTLCGAWQGQDKECSLKWRTDTAMFVGKPTQLRRNVDECCLCVRARMCACVHLRAFHIHVHMCIAMHE